MWVHKCQMKRKSQGEFWSLYKELKNNEIKFYLHIRITKYHFNYLLHTMGKAFEGLFLPKERL